MCVLDYSCPMKHLNFFRWLYLGLDRGSNANQYYFTEKHITKCLQIQGPELKKKTLYEINIYNVQIR